MRSPHSGPTGSSTSPATPRRSRATSATSCARGIASSGCSRWTCSRRRRTSRPWPVFDGPHEDVPHPSAAPVAARPFRRLVRRLLHPPPHGRPGPRPAAAGCVGRGRATLPRGDGIQRSVLRPVRALPLGRAARRLRPVGAPRRARVRSRCRADAGHVRAGGRRPWRRAGPRDPCGHRLGGPAQHAARLRLHDRRPARPVDADLLAGNHAHPHLLGAVQPAPVVRARRARAPDPARGDPRPVHDRAHHAAHAVGDARGPEPGLHPDGAREGRERPAGHLEARAQERGDPDRDDRRH